MPTSIAIRETEALDRSVHGPAPVSPRASGAGGGPSAREPRRLLLVDDDSYVVEALKEFLEHEGEYEVLCAGDGDAALDLAERELPDLILLDLRMPGLDGFEVCRYLQGNTETLHIPIVIFTVKDNVADVVKAFQLGAVDYILKPFSPAVLLRQLRETLDLFGH